MLTAERLRELLDYDPETGVFTRRITTGRNRRWKAGDKVSGRPSATTGYLGIGIGKRRYAAHRLAWLWMTGEWPKNLMDHRDCDRTNNRWVNLREASYTDNARNSKKGRSNTSGYKGVSWSKQKSKWLAQIIVDRRQIYLGRFADLEDAAAAYAAAAVKYHGEFANKGE